MMSPPTVRRIARSTVMSMPPVETEQSYTLKHRTQKWICTFGIHPMLSSWMRESCDLKTGSTFPHDALGGAGHGRKNASEPTGTRLWRSMISLLNRRMQPVDTYCPSYHGSVVS